MARHDDDEGRVRGERWPRRSHEDPEEGEGEEEWYEPRVMDFAKKIVRQGAEVVWTTQGALRERASHVRGDIRSREIPKELVESVAHMTTRTKDELVGLMAREFKNYLEKMDLAGELRKVAENYTLDVNMKIRLTPNEGYVAPAGFGMAGEDDEAADGAASGESGDAVADEPGDEPEGDGEDEIEDEDENEDEQDDEDSGGE